ncbi:hypothetical protein KUF54_00500 [Comamonas sp. Y33R10-2]|uniref:hypothetical protein n=1 Tax=Comamonas sp. Y33R10-2 TaxID=2853257 RepID=UPI001C5C9D04|nr:hypothetical protein [Comamonas sp. Y33R10-2]QXZ09795.1 hypothetical protein KUF54_00500 [Comamonas sp. Y33R10-2]
MFDIVSVPSFLPLQTGIPRDDGLMIYAPEELAERNETYEVTAYLPGHWMIGGDSGGRGILVDPVGALWICGLGALFLEDREPLAPSLAQWVEQGCPIPSWEDAQEDED